MIFAKPVNILDFSKYIKYPCDGLIKKCMAPRVFEVLIYRFSILLVRC